MAQWPLMLAALVTGALVPLQLAFNGQLGGVTRNAFTASLIVFLVGVLVLSVIVVVTRPTLPTISELAAAPKTVWLGGAIATGYIVAIVVLTPRLGVGLTTGLILIGQILTALALDHLGAFGNPQYTLNAGRLTGLALMIAGIATIKAY
ncbi:MAG: DMT family transporter [Yoonia sp.]|uniref:DMT family transporter n=1 Tax=Yoonia sp. TaxID=2212373 RepID=UPI00273E751A|nr:DMT family transporter [Yoonia sp.]MDP5085907.1 DMT family transporter [Yoonia sp.]